MISDELYCKLCMIMFQEESRLKDNVISSQNFILKYRPIDPVPYIKLYKAQAILDYYNKYSTSFLRWIEHYSGKGDC